MSKKNQFHGAVMSKAIISAYYPSNPDFDHFTFQQVLDDSTKPDDDYTLIVYAVVHSGPPVLLPPIADTNDAPFNAGKKLHFANMKLDAAGLIALYPRGVTSDLTINPGGLYLNTNYIYYTGSASYIFNDDVVTTTHPINPSPPA